MLLWQDVLWTFWLSAQKKKAGGAPAFFYLKHERVLLPFSFVA